MTAADIISSIFRKYEKKSLSPKEIRDESSRICKLLNSPEVGDPGRTARGFAEEGFVIKDSEGNCTYDSTLISEELNAKFCRYEYVYDRIPESALTVKYFLEIPLVDRLDTDDYESALGKILAEEKKRGSYAIHYFGLKYAKLITEKNISKSEIVKKAKEINPTVSENYADELHKAIGIYNLAKADGFEKTSVGDGSTLLEQEQIEQDLFSFDDTNNDISPLILYGPPGTGKTYKMQHDYINKFSKDNCFITTFHQSFSYEEFVEGLKPVLLSNDTTETQSSDVKYEIQKGIFYKACERAAELAGYEPSKTENALQKCIADSERSSKMSEAIKYNKIVLLCIDEINRANVSAVFGDLISLIESSKRIGAENEMNVTLPYSKEVFAVPANLMIVGTMNTADRSIQLLDSALRRRFRFEELLPEYNKITNDAAKTILQRINARIRCLLDKDHQIGHSYFIDAKSDLDIFNALKNCVIPLLEEYFYNDAQKIRQVLNEKEDTENPFYILDDDALEALNSIDNDYDDEKKLYMLDPKLADVKDDDSAKSFLSHI